MALHEFSAENLVNLMDSEAKTLNGAPFTVRSKKTSKDYTFKIKHSVFNGRAFLHAYVEQEYLRFKHLGYFAHSGDIVKKGTKVDSPSALAIAWLLRQVKSMKVEELKKNVEVFHIGKCLKCGKTLTDVESLEHGFGPICRNSI